MESSKTASAGTTAATVDEPGIANFYHVSYSYYSCVVFTGTLFVGLLISILTCSTVNSS